MGTAPYKHQKEGASIGLSALRVKGSTIITSITSSSRTLQRRVLSVNLAPNARIAVVGCTPVNSPLRVHLHNCRLALHGSSTTHVRLINVRSASANPHTGTTVNAARRPTLNRKACSPHTTGATIPRNTPLRFTLTNGRGYNGAALFGRLANSGRRINGFPNIAISHGSNAVHGRPRTDIASLPNVCSLSPCANRRIIDHRFVLSRHPSTVVSVVSTAGVRHGLCLALRLVRLSYPVIVTLGVVSRIATGNNTISIGLLRDLLNIPIIPVDTTHGRNVNRLISRTLRITQFHRHPNHLSFYTPSNPSNNTLRHYVRNVTGLVRSRTIATRVPIHFTTAGLIRNSRLMARTLRLSHGRLSTVRRVVARVRNRTNASHLSTLTSVHFDFVNSIYKHYIIGPRRDHRRIHSIGVSHVLANHCATVPTFLIVVNLIF